MAQSPHERRDRGRSRVTTPAALLRSTQGEFVAVHRPGRLYGPDCDCGTRTQIAAGATTAARSAGSEALRSCYEHGLSIAALLPWLAAERKNVAAQNRPRGRLGPFPGSALCAGDEHRVLSTGQVPGCEVSSSRTRPGQDAMTHRGHLRRPWEIARLWVPSNRMPLRRMRECVAGNANPDAELQVRLVASALSVAWGSTSDRPRIVDSMRACAQVRRSPSSNELRAIRGGAEFAGSTTRHP